MDEGFRMFVLRWFRCWITCLFVSWNWCDGKLKAAGLSFEAPGGIKQISPNARVHVGSINTPKFVCISLAKHWGLGFWCHYTRRGSQWNFEVASVAVNGNRISVHTDYRKPSGFCSRAAHHFFPFVNISKSSIIQFVSLMAGPLSTETFFPPLFFYLRCFIRLPARSIKSWTLLCIHHAQTVMFSVSPPVLSLRGHSDMARGRWTKRL